MSSTIVLRCAGCNARIKAPRQLLGQTRPCPGCKRHLSIRYEPPGDAGPVMVPESKNEIDLAR
jgi:hypothetical protein